MTSTSHLRPPHPRNGLLDEAARLDALRRYAILDTPPEAFFDGIAALAATIFQAPMATITFVDEARQWFKARFGLDVAQTARAISFCHQTIQSRDVMVVLDAERDQRFADNPLVRDTPSIRFYAGAPLITDRGAAIGTLVVLDTRPRRAFSARERWILRSLADHVMRELEVRRAAGDVRQEITDRVNAHAALQRADEVFRLALGATAIGVFTLDSDLVWTWAFNRVCGREAADLEGRHAAELFAPEDAALLDRLGREVLETNSGVHAHIRCRGPSGAPMQVDYRLEPLLDTGGKPDGIVGVAIDVTDETRLQREAVIARARIEVAARSRSHFLAAASHDLRQPFQAMRLFADILAQRLTEPNQQFIMQKLNEAMRAGEGLLNALLEISVLEAGILQPRPGPFPVQPVTQRLAEQFRPLAAEKGLELHHCVPHVDVVTDPALFERMLGHLLANAVRFTPQGKILVGGRVRGGELMLQVWDTGTGMSGEELRTIFEPFYQIGNPERDRAKGLGLGLAIVDQTARLLGHRLSVRSLPGRGTVFTICVPLAPER